MDIRIFFYISLVFLYLITGQIRFLFAQDGVQLEIKSQSECQALGGAWNDCPPNECQESERYKKGEIVCPSVCGNARCEGIVPEEEGDLSEIHNPTVYEESTPPNEEPVPPNDAVTPLYDTIPSEDKNTVITSSVYQIAQDFFRDGDSARALLIILGLVILYVYFLIKHKRRKRK